MAEKILSQDEVDALLKGVVSGDVDTSPKQEEPDQPTKAYDLLNQEKIIRGRMPAMEMINDRFTRLQASTWRAALHEEIDFSIVSTQVIKFGEFIKKIPLPSSLSIFSMEPFRGQCLFVMDAFLVYLLVDHFFGGSGQTHVKPEGRDFTMVQQRVIKTVVAQSLADLEKAWQALAPVRIKPIRSESNPQFATVVGPSEIVIAVTLQVALGENTRDFFLAYPYSMMEPIKEKLYSGLVSEHTGQDSGWPNKFKAELQSVSIRATARLGTTTVRVRDVMNFSPGDVLVLDQGPGDPLRLMIEGAPKFEGTAGVVRGGQAFKISRVLTSPDDR
ncbi:MAG: flagellar motor switch protein FliM [Nitrospira sp.]|nr:MAG: flagellar motor switch protein FliM [Nitrospira sp.]